MMLKCPSCSADLIDPAYDAKFNSVSSLRWVPWVGVTIKSRAGKRIMIVGESHYERARAMNPLTHGVGSWRNQKEYTREMIWEGVFSGDLKSRTYDMDSNRYGWRRELLSQRILGSVAYYKPHSADAELRCHAPERPTRDDFVQGWTVFSEVRRY
jgi:hypothetical protein